MKEFVFALDYESGCNDITEVLTQHPDAQIRSLSCHVTPASVWRVDHVTGPQIALDAIESVFLDPDHCTDCLATPDCGAECDNSVLDRDEDTLVVYSRWSKARACTSVPHLALHHLGDGLLFETHRSERRYEWRIIAPDNTTYHAFRSAIEDEIDDTTGVAFVRVGDAEDATPDDSEASLTPQQDAAVRAAIEHGYYQTPREIETYELAEKLGIPGSTLSYRLRRAEAQLADAYATDHSSSTHLSFPDA
jgi:predicted DNA binding protein